jgi:hypothetical protein
VKALCKPTGSVLLAVFLSGTVPDNSQSQTMDLSLTRAGDFFGTIAVGNQPVTILSTGGASYLKINRRFLKEAELPYVAR